MKTFGAICFALAIHVPRGVAENVVIPFSFGDSESQMPFGLRTLGLDSMRYQQVYSGAPFAALNPGGVWIMEIRFADEAGFWASDQPLFQLNLSTTARGPDNLSSVFEENVGPNNTIVFGPGSHTFSRSSSETFGTTLPMSQPFFFDPSQGNLLLDVRNYMKELDQVPHNYRWQPQRAQNVSGDPVSIVHAPDVNATTGTVETLGLLTLFVVEVPEPSVGLLSLIGLAALASLGRASVHKTNHPEEALRGRPP